MTDESCSACGEVKPLEDFHRDRGRPDGRASCCADCGRARSRNYYAQNQEARRESARTYARDNPAKMRDHEAKRPAESKWVRVYRASCRKAGVDPVIVPFSAADVIAAYGDACVDCGSSKWHLRHTIPVAAGGAHALTNVRPRCHPCANVKLNQFDKRMIRLYRTGTHLPHTGVGEAL